MRNRYLILGLAVFIALAMAVPALGGPSNPIASSSANALKVAKKAKQKANAAQATADSAAAAAAAAQTAANNAQTAASNAATAATNANNNANSRYDHVNHVDGTASPTNNADKSLVAANCAGADDAATGGGWVTNGSGGERDAQVEYNSTFYNDQWVVVANDLGNDAGTWSITPTAQCIGT
jgi:hypothetical protein